MGRRDAEGDTWLHPANAGRHAWMPVVETRGAAGPGTGGGGEGMSGGRMPAEKTMRLEGDQQAGRWCGELCSPYRKKQSTGASCA